MCLTRHRELHVLSPLAAEFGKIDCVLHSNGFIHGYLPERCARQQHGHPRIVIRSPQLNLDQEGLYVGNNAPDQLICIDIVVVVHTSASR